MWSRSFARRHKDETTNAMSRLLRCALVVLGLWGVGLAARAAAAPAQTTNGVPAAIPKSVFKFDPQNGGRDPFFPNQATGQSTATPTPSPVRPLVFKGFSGSESNRLVLINNKTLKMNEETQIRVSADQEVTVKLVRILDKAVQVLVNGQEETLKLQSTELPIDGRAAQ